MVKFITGQSGSGKSTRLAEYIDKLSDEGKNLCIIVPEQFSYEFDKNLYKKLGAVKFNKIFSLTFTGLSRQLFQLYGDNNRKGVYADDLSKIVIMEEALFNLSKTPDGIYEFRKQTKRHGFIEQILKIITNFKRAAITPYQFQEKTAFLSGKFKRKADDISNIYFEYEKLLKEKGYKDNLTDISEAAKIASLHEYFKGKTVFIDEFDSFTGEQYEFIKVIIQHADDLYITLRTDDVNAGEFTLFEAVNKTYRKITAICNETKTEYSNEICNGLYRFNSSDLAHLSLNILRNKISTDKLKSDNIRLFESRDPYVECEYVCSTIKRLLYNDKKLKYSDIAIISNKTKEYAGILESTFERYEIPYFISLEKSVSHTAIMVMLSVLIEIITAKKYSSEHIFRLLKCELTDISLLEISILEDYCYKYSIDGDKWKKAFVSDDKNTPIAEEIRSKIIKKLDSLKRKCNNADIRTICTELYNFIINVGADKRISHIMGELINENKDYLAAEQKRIWSFFIQIIETLTDTIGDKSIPLKEFGILFKTLLSQIKFSIPPQTIDSLTVAPAQTARLNSPKIVFIMGVNEGDFPNIINTHDLLSEDEKQKLADMGMEISRPTIDLISDEKLIVYKSLSIASDKLYLTYPLSDLSGNSQYPAMIIQSIKELLENSNDILLTEEKIPQHYYAVTFQSAFYHFMQWQKQNNTSIMSIKKILEDNSEYRNKIEFIYQQYNYKGNYNIPDKTLLEELKSFTPLKLSSTKLELYNSCHFKYFCNEILKLSEREKVELNPIYIGNIIHNCFYKLLSRRTKNEFISMNYEKLSEEIIFHNEEFKQNNMSGDFEQTPRFDMNYKKLTQQIIKVATHMQEELMQSDFAPVKFEYGIGKSSNSLTLSFAGDKTLKFNGIVDRIDTCSINDDKYIRIIDYKSKIKNINPLNINNGINMQMLLYLFALTDNGMDYYDYKTAGVLYSPVKILMPDLENAPSDKPNITQINSSLKMDGLLLDSFEVLDAMENGLGGKYIPPKYVKTKNAISNKSNCIPIDSFEKLRNFTYKKLIQTGELIYNGDFAVNPLNNKQYKSCDFCSYLNICGNTNMVISRDGTETDMQEINEIFNITEEAE